MRVTKYKTMLNESGLPELVKEKSNNYECGNLVNPEKIADMMRNVFRLHRETEEYLYEICFTAKMKPIGVFEISHGFANGTIANPREIFQKALMCGAVSIAIVHNHPSGECDPSEDDAENAYTLKESGKLLGVELVDSIILAEEKYFSFAEKGW